MSVLQYKIRIHLCPLISIVYVLMYCIVCRYKYTYCDSTGREVGWVYEHSSEGIDQNIVQVSIAVSVPGEMAFDREDRAVHSSCDIRNLSDTVPVISVLNSYTYWTVGIELLLLQYRMYKRKKTRPHFSISNNNNIFEISIVNWKRGCDIHRLTLTLIPSFPIP